MPMSKAIHLNHPLRSLRSHRLGYDIDDVTHSESMLILCSYVIQKYLYVATGTLKLVLKHT